MKINKNIKDFFENLSIDIESLFDNEDDNLDKLINIDSKILLSKINNIQDVNDMHKILFAACLLELRSQVKKNQEQISETRKQIEKELKIIQKTLSSIEKTISNKDILK